MSSSLISVPDARSHPNGVADESRQVEVHLFLPPFFDRERDSGFLDRLGQSLLTHGPLHPVRCKREPGDGQEMFRVLTGYSKVLAARRVGIRTLWALVLSRELTETEIIMETIVENELRSETSELDKYRAYARLCELNGWAHAELARQLHILPSEVAKTFARCERLPPDLVEKIGSADGKIPPRAAYDLSRLSDPAVQKELAELVMQGRLTVDRLHLRLEHILGNGKQKKPKTLKHQDGPAAVVIPTNWPGEKIVEWLSARLAMAKDWMRKGVPPEKWGTL